MTALWTEFTRVQWSCVANELINKLITMGTRELIATCVLAVALAACGQAVKSADTVQAPYDTDDFLVCLGGRSADICKTMDLTNGQWLDSAPLTAASRCTRFMQSARAPTLDANDRKRFWPSSDAGRYHEDLLANCGELWADVQTGRPDAEKLAVARLSAKQFFEHCLESTSRLSYFEADLYCLDMYGQSNSMVRGYPREYWAYPSYRTALDKNSEQLSRVARAVCEKLGVREACDDVEKAGLQLAGKGLAGKSRSF